MATGRISYVKTTVLGAQLSSVIGKLVEGRKALEELNRVVARYNDANTDIATDSGIPSGSVQAFKDILARASAELTGGCLVQLNVNDLTFVRTLLDSMA